MPSPNDDSAGKVGIEQAIKTPRELYDNTHGRYTDPIPAIPVEKRLPVLPMVIDPKPFNLGGGTQ
jgi:hypothetical protein